MLRCSDKAGADQLDERLSEAEKVLGEYVRRLEAEEKERKDLQELLEVFVWQHRQQLRESKKKLKVSITFNLNKFLISVLIPIHKLGVLLIEVSKLERLCLAAAIPFLPVQHYQTKLERVRSVKEELTLKLARLPDLSKLPTSSHGSLAPLPSVGDLFN